MLPFSDIDFLLVMGLLISILWIFKWVHLPKPTFSGLITILCLIYLIVYYPYPIHISFVIIYSYSIYYLFSFVLKHKNKLAGSIILLLPMILVKSDIRVHYYPFQFNNWISFAGLSFISFRTLQVYLETQTTDKPVNPIRYVSFLIYTPTLLIGPIDRFNRFNDDLNKGYSQLNVQRFSEGFQALLYGVLYKYVLAECISRYWLNTFDPSSRDIFFMANNMYGYFLYLFFDFAGYSHMAIGISKMMGIDVPQNFNLPFLARNPQDFWRRFHITLGDWLKDYFFKPFYLFLSKLKVFQPYPLLRQNISLFLTFTLMGCWNGFKPWFIISGMLFGIYSLVYNSYVYYSKKKRRDIIFGKIKDKYINWISIVIMFNLAAFSIYIFSGRFPFIH